MSAYEKGIQIGRAYLYRTPHEKVTVAQVGAMARTCAKHHYKTEAKQQEFVRGWFAITKQFETMFKDYPTQLRIMGIILKCEHCQTTFEVEYDDPVDFGELHKIKEQTCPICHDTGKVIERGKE